MTTIDDVKAFLRFMSNYPGKYMGRKYRIDETYATWLINFTPMPDNEKERIDSLYSQIKTDVEFNKWKQTYGRYSGVASYDITAIQTHLYGSLKKITLKLSVIDGWVLQKNIIIPQSTIISKWQKLGITVVKKNIKKRNKYTTGLQKLTQVMSIFNGFVVYFIWTLKTCLKLSSIWNM